jgi:hypothetical protein
VERKEKFMRYYDDETDYPFDYENMMNNGFDDLLEEEDYTEDEAYEVNDDNDIDEWVNSYNNIEDEIVDE